MSTFHPVHPADRQPLLDILRGFALFGVVVANYANYSATGDTTEPPQWIMTTPYLLMAYLIFTKAYTLLAFLFGYGFGLLFDNLRRSQTPGAGLFFAKRMFWLFCFGLLNTVFWEGDILKSYALLGLWLWFCRHWKTRWLVRGGIFLLLADALLSFVDMAFWADPARADLSKRIGEMLAAGYQSASFWEYVKAGFFAAGHWPLLSGEFLVIGCNFSSAGLMLLGLAACQVNLLGDWPRHAPFLKKLCIWGGILGILFGAISWAFVKIPALKLETPWNELRRAVCWLTINRYGMAACYLGGLAWLFCSGKTWLRVFAPVGRMALSNYVAQGVVSMLLVSGVFLGLFGKIPLWSYPVLAVAVFALQLIVSPLWLRRFRFGPVEWVWRKLTYPKV